LKNDDPIIEAFKNLADQHYRWGLLDDALLFT
jgi:hypothetical protein